nr:FABP2 [Pseudechiniscus sp.]WPK49608.1 FABP3 [Pseudechiniscus sp.]
MASSDVIVGTYKLESSDNFDEYMKAIGVGLVTRKLGASATPVVTITKEGDGKYRLKTETAMKTSEIAFRIGEQFDEETLDGRQVKTVVTQPVPNKLVQVQRKDDFESTITRDFTPQGLTTTLVYKDVKAVRKYNRVNQ